MSSSPTAPSAASSSSIELESSSRRYGPVPPAFSPLAQPNPCAHVQAAKITPMVFPEPRKPVNYEDGWNYFRRIGEPKHVCAPMVNQSELAFRLLCRRYDTTLAFTPMFHAEIFGKDPKYRAEQMQVPKNAQEDRPLVVQFCGHDPKLILKAAKLVEHCADAVDLNLGCPQNIAKRGFYGSFLLEQTQLLHDIVSTLHQYLSIPITCKIRRLPPASSSPADIQAANEATIALVKMLQEAGAAMITIHGRSRLQLKDKVGACDFDLIRLVKQNCAVPVFANGGIYDAEDVRTCLAYTGVDGVMSSEALLCNPALFAGGARPCGLQLAREYMDIVADLEKNQGLPTEQSMIRGHLFKILYRHLGVHTDLRDRLSTCKPEEFEDLLAELNARFAALKDDAEREAVLAQMPFWYHRHILTPKQREEAEAKRLKQQAEREERERCEAEGLCDAINVFDEV